MEFPKQEYWHGLPLPTPGDSPKPEFEAASPEASALAGRFFTTGRQILYHWATWEVPIIEHNSQLNTHFQKTLRFLVGKFSKSNEIKKKKKIGNSLVFNG